MRLSERGHNGIPAASKLRPHSRENEPSALILGGSFPQDSLEEIAQNIKQLQFQLNIHLLKGPSLNPDEIKTLLSMLACDPLLEEMAIAHIQTVERMLNQSSDFFTPGPVCPAYMRSEEIFLDLWGMTWLKKERELWVAVVRAHHENSLSELEIQMPSFQQFLGPDYHPLQY